MNAWARRGMQAALLTSGMLALGAGVAAASECCPDRPTPPLAASSAGPLSVDTGTGSVVDGAAALGAVGWAARDAVAAGATGGRHRAEVPGAEVPVADVRGAEMLGAEVLGARPLADRASVGWLAHLGSTGPGFRDLPERVLAAAPAGLDGTGLPPVGTLPAVPEFPDLADLAGRAEASHGGPASRALLAGIAAVEPGCVAPPGKDCVAAVEPARVVEPGRAAVPEHQAAPALRVLRGGMASVPVEGGAMPAAIGVPAVTTPATVDILTSVVTLVSVETPPAVDGSPASIADPAVAALTELDMMRELVIELSGLVDLPLGLPSA